jgi:2-keto-4-pentenoate hydratase/2-oxohepta-3-ene-1,7-dioic acid hydratase in catechol pathway
VRICRFTPLASNGEEILYGVLTGEVDEFGQPSEDSVIVALAGDPLYVGVKLARAGAPPRGRPKLLAPVLPRSKVVGIGKNYAAHAAEMGGDVPTEPLMFLKPNTSVVGPATRSSYPPQSTEVDYEGELAVVIGRICRDVPPSARRRGDPRLHGRQRRDRPRPAAQGRPVHALQGLRHVLPARPVDRDRARPARRRVSVQTYRNGDLVQDGNTSDMVFDIPALIAHVSSVMTLLPGDVILTGTPEGVGPMEAGDEIEIVVAGIGSLTNKVALR